MFIIDDFILATIIVFGILVLATLVAPALCILGVLLGLDTVSRQITGGAKPSLKNQTKQVMETLDKAEKSVNKLKEKIELISFTDAGIKSNPVEKMKELYNKAPINSGELVRQENYIKIARDIYKKEKVKDIFDVNYKNMLEFTNGSSKHLNDKPDIDTNTINKLIKYRTLEEDYPITNNIAWGNYNVKSIDYNPIDKKEFDAKMNQLFEFAILESVRELKPAEEKLVNSLADDFYKGKLTNKTMTANFYDAPPIKIDTCQSHALKHAYSNKYKPLHWGQRKLLLSEIDFFSRVAHDMGLDTFKSREISLVYPGSAHGHHLMLEMDMYPNIIMYLWDPAMYNPVLYLADFMRRKLPLNFPYKPEHKTLADKYVGRVFINMELSNKDFIEYHKNATTLNIPKNYKTQWGFFTKKSADYYLKHLEKTKSTKTRTTLFVSDIRLFTNQLAKGLLLYSRITDYSNIIALNVAAEKNNDDDYIRDMQLQRDWMSFCKADYGLFKFKLKTKNYIVDNLQSEYLNGDIVLQVWAPVSSTETRLFVAPRHQKVNGGIAFYNVEKYTDKLATFNIHMRLADFSKVKLSDIGIDIPDKTLGDIWTRFLMTEGPSKSVIGMDAVLETYMLYDYLLIYKNKKDIKYTDLILMISDITQTLLNHFDYRGILGYLRNMDTHAAEKLLSYRNNYHKKFIRRLDYQSSRADRAICGIIRN